jgi:uncharacterized coiled-coil protein SlyX
MTDVNHRLIDLEKKVAGQEVMVSKFDSALDKMSEVSLNVSKLLAVHEKRLETQEEHAKESKEADAQLHSRLSSTEQRLRQEMSDGQKEILTEIKGLHTKVDDLKEDIHHETENMRTEIEADIEKKLDSVTKRVGKLERFAYILIGGGTILGFIIHMLVETLWALH